MENKTKIIIGAAVVIGGSLTALWFYNRKASAIPAPADVPVKGSFAETTINKPVVNTPVKVNPPVDSRIGKSAYAINDNTSVYGDKGLKTIWKVANKGDFIGKVKEIDHISSLDWARTTADNYVYVNAVYYK